MDEVQLEKRLSTIEGQLVDLQCDVGEIKRDIGGNGKTGIAHQVLINTERINVMIEADKKRQAFWEKIGLLIVGAIITNIIAIIAAALSIAYLTP